MSDFIPETNDAANSISPIFRSSFAAPNMPKASAEALFVLRSSPEGLVQRNQRIKHGLPHFDVGAARTFILLGRYCASGWLMQRSKVLKLYESKNVVIFTYLNSFFSPSVIKHLNYIPSLQFCRYQSPQIWITFNLNASRLYKFQHGDKPSLSLSSTF